MRTVTHNGEIRFRPAQRNLNRTGTAGRSSEQPRPLERDHDASPSSGPNHVRVNSRDYVHSYEGSYADGNDMAGFHIFRNTGSWFEEQMWFLFLVYVIVLFIVAFYVEVMVSFLTDPTDEQLTSGRVSLTITNTIHFFVTLTYVHWMKGGTCWQDHDGDLDHLTLWEQIEAIPNTGWLRFALRNVPAVLCYLACWQSGWEAYICAFNVIVWFFTLLGKLPWMNGVRVLGINSHITDHEPMPMDDEDTLKTSSYHWQGVAETRTMKARKTLTPSPFIRRAQNAVPVYRAIIAKPWIQCFKCQKWRRLPSTSNWECRMNTWRPSFASCDAPEETDYM
ncbi:Saccharomyces cerevisiae [Seminavis robusta]|uniref:Saccharomyces cerevisiae n=1 Tax=Seminavis robusta TaxID=568900 RepID=A0A9N8DCX1_9STRA|nr:Saccharomyces cerevisiae [Seminavis robusta]|eukprot:Sro33_g021350.1 Saccharomyces cerevisiae (335) ;mRNA; f:58699-59703